jgi:DNA-binding NtrC family response regulator
MQSPESVGSLNVLSVSPLEDDHISLQMIIRRSTWILHKANRLAPALEILRHHGISVVVCERDLLPGRWADLLDGINNLSQPPSLIVTSRLADERLWGEALNLGAWDVLAKPFQHQEVVRSIKSAWRHWYGQVQLAGKPANVLKAVS